MPIIEVENLTKRYADLVAVDDVSFTIEPGEIFAILGPNGAGKTTTVETIAGLRVPDSGSVRVMGLDPRHDPEVRERLGVQLQESMLPDRIKVWEALDLYSSFYREPGHWADLLERLGLAEKRDATFVKLSGGQKQRLSIALALVGNPEVAILEELTTGLDPQARRDTWGLIEEIRGHGVTIVLVTHFMEEAERLADRIALIDSGRLVALDTPAGLIGRVSQEQRIEFRSSRHIDVRQLGDLPEVTAVEQTGDRIVIRGVGNLLHAVTSYLARNQIIAEQLRVEQVSLDDAFVALTGSALESDNH